MKDTAVVLTLVGILALCLGILMFLILTEQAPIRVHIESVGPTVERGSAKEREALRDLGVDRMPLK
jgi:hypothetical protein